jgi:hypothetical protein
MEESQGGEQNVQWKRLRAGAQLSRGALKESSRDFAGQDRCAFSVIDWAIFDPGAYHGVVFWPT